MQRSFTFSANLQGVFALTCNIIDLNPRRASMLFLLLVCAGFYVGVRSRLSILMTGPLQSITLPEYLDHISTQARRHSL